MINMFLFFGIVFIFTFLIGKLMERMNVPWIFASLLLGFFLAIYNPFTSITSSQAFEFLAQLGMYFLLFVIGFEIDLNELKKTSKFILKSTVFIIFLEALLGGILLKIIFGYTWFMSFIVALSFATVGEAVLIPILDKFKIVNTKLGQSIIGIGTLDDIVEVFVLVLVTSTIASGLHSYFHIGVTLLSLAALFALTFGLTKLKEEGKKFGFLNIETLFLFVLFVFFLFLGIGEYAHSTAAAALLSGIALKTFIPNKRLEFLENEVRTMCYGFFAPIFFLWVGESMKINYLDPVLVLLVVLASGGAKIIGSCIAGWKELGMKKSIILGIGLCTRFSTSIIIVKMLMDSGLIGSDLYSTIIASSIVFVFIIPIIFSNLIARWVKG